MSLDRSHPVAQLLLAAAQGNHPTKRQLDSLLATPDAGEAVNLARFRRDLQVAVDEVVTIATCGDPSGNTRDHHSARRRADELVGTFAGRMTAEEIAVDDTANLDNVEDLAEITERMFPRW